MSDGVSETPEDSIFHESNVPAYTLLYLMHIKDLLGAILLTSNKEFAESLAEIHGNGELLFKSPPHLGNADDAQ